MHLGQADGGETGALIQEARNDLPECQLAGEAGAESLREAEAAGDFGGSPDGTDGRACCKRTPSSEARAERSPLCLRASSMAATSAGSHG